MRGTRKDTMTILANATSFVIATALIVAAWAVYLWLNNLISKMPASWFREVLGGILSFGLLATIGLILNFLAVPFAMGLLTISVLLLIWYAIRKTLRPTAT